MGHFRFRRRIGNKFLKFNISKTGFSITSGVPGAHVNVPLVGSRKRKVMSTLSIPGTGLSYRESGGKLRGGRGSVVQGGVDNIPFFQQIMYFTIGLIVVLTLWSMW